jgi:hypothetical protein
MVCDMNNSSNKKVSSRFLQAGIDIALVSLLLCFVGVNLVLAANLDVPGGVTSQSVTAPDVGPAGGNIPSLSVPQVFDRSVVSTGGNTLVHPGTVSGSVMRPVPVSNISLPGGGSGMQQVTPLVGVSVTSETYSDIEWQKTFGGSDFEEAKSIQQTSDGGYIVAGYSRSNNGDVTGNHGGYDAWVVKISSSGMIQWKKSFGGSGDDSVSSIKQTNDGGYIFAGSSDSKNGDVTENHGASDYWIVKLTSSGTIQWSKNFGGPDNEYAYSIQQTFDGGYIVAGFGGSSELDHHGGGDYWILKLSSSGNIEWKKCYGGSWWDYAYSIQQTNEGGYIVAGYAMGTHGFNEDFWVLKLSSKGILQWEKYYGGTKNDGAHCVQQTSDGEYIVAGYTQSNDGDVSGNHGDYDIWVVKLSSTGVIQWQKCLGGSSSDSGNSIRETSDGGYIVAGNTYSNNGDVSGYHYGSDVWVVKLSSTGAIQWQKCLGGSGHDSADSIQQTNDGGYIIAGYTGSNDGDLTGNERYYADFWIIKLKGTGLSAPDKIGVFRSSSRGWFLDYNGNGAWGTGDRQYTFGVASDKPVTGNWNGNVNGKANIGVVRGKTWYVDYNGNGYWDSADKSATFGVGDGKDIPVTGNWNGNGKTNIGVVRGKTWYVDYNGNGYWDSADKTATFGVGDGKDKPVTGDWSGNGKTNIGVVRGKIWYVDYNGNGYWDSADKTATFGVGDGKDIPVTGDWNGNGKTNIGVVRGKTWYVDYNENGYWDSADKTATFGVGDGKDIPVVGKWSGTGVASVESVEANQVQEPEKPIQPPTVTRPESDIPRVEMPVKSSPAVSPMSGGGVVPPQNPLVSGGGARVSGRPAL